MSNPINRQIVFGGGLDFMTPAMITPVGSLRFSQNYEIALTGGYRRVDGYERFDGRQRPSDATYYVLAFHTGGVSLTSGATVSGGTSGATGLLLIDAVVASGSWAGDATGYLVLKSSTGVWVNNEAIRVGGVFHAYVSGSNGAVLRGAPSPALDALYYQAAITSARGLIAGVPGSGPVRGVWVFQGVVYAFRNNTAGTAGNMWKSTAAGWVSVVLGTRIGFTSGSGSVTIGQTLTNTTTGKTGIIVAIQITSGDFTTGNASGTVYLKSTSGTFTSGVTNTPTGAMLVATPHSNNTLVAGGLYRFINYNFTGHAGGVKMYGCNGVGWGFQYDGSGFAFIRTGMTNDVPIFLAGHKHHLFFAFAQGSLQHSALGDPLSWEPLLGAGEIGTGGTITGLEVSQGVLVIFNRDAVYILYGTSSGDWSLVTHSADSGAIPNTLQLMGQPVFLSDRGLLTLEASQTYGDFQISAVSHKIHSLINAAKDSVISSMRVREKNQYRMFFSTGAGIIASLVGGSWQFTQLFYPHSVECTCSGETAGTERLFFGSTDGFIYEMDRGTSFDGQTIEAFLQVANTDLGISGRNKRFHQLQIETDAPNGATLSFAPDFAYSDPDLPVVASEGLFIRSGGGFWDVDTWDSFNWSEPTVGIATGYLSGIGRNFGVFFYSTTATERPHTLQGMTLTFSVLGRVKA
jgi:hypothetical protein